MISEDELRYYKQLDERQGRLFLGMKAKLLGRGGCRIVSEAFGVNIKRMWIILSMPTHIICIKSIRM
ncbi:MAG: hypothetical protein LBV71_15530 [Prevotella sp.]|jgi:hypothetical protein|nr:hypothetical protein [Prevotella sp.]